MTDAALDKVAHHLSLDGKSLAILKSTGLSQRDMLGVAYLSKVSGRSIFELVELRSGSEHWSAVSRDLGYPMDFGEIPRGPKGLKSDRGEESAR